MAEVAVFGFNCTNPDCGKLFKMRYPGKPGYFKVSCPHCGQPVTVKVPAPAPAASNTSGVIEAEDNSGRPPRPEPPAKPKVKTPGEREPLPETDDKTSGKTKQEEADTQQPDNSGAPVIDYRDYPGGDGSFFVDEEAVFECPHCRSRKLRYTATKEGMLTFSCPGCKGKTRVMFKRPTILIDPERFNDKQGKLVHVRSFWRSTEYPLPLGEHTVGRADMEKPSTINIKGDGTMSRRSISITAACKPHEGFSYLLRVLNATNPVLVGGSPLTQGEEVYLKFGDEIKLGNTLMRFAVDDKAPRFKMM